VRKITAGANDIGNKQILLNDFLINAAQSANIYYKHEPSKNFLIKELQSNAIKHFSGENTIEKLWESILSDEYYLYDSETPSKTSLNNNDIVELSNVILSVWNPLFPGLFYTKYFWNQPEKS